jgi:hypothetical protein
VAQAAGLDLLAEHGGRGIALCGAGTRIAAPRDIPALVETDDEPFLRIVLSSEWPPALLVTSPVDVSRALAVTGLAADADFGPSGREAIVRGIVVLAYARRVAPRAHEVPVLVQLGPVQDIVVANVLVRVQMEPALPARLLWAAVPGNRQSLQTTVGKLDQILLQRLNAEGVFDLECGELAVGAVGLDQEFPVLAEKAGKCAVMIEACAIEVAGHRLVGRMLHGELVM